MTDVARQLAALAAVALAGCSSPGFLYTDITLPLTVDMGATPRAREATCGVQRVVREPFTGAGIRAEWAGYAPGEAARQGGIETIHYADIRRESVVGGVWSATTALVYGTRDGRTRPSAPGESTAAAEEAERECQEQAF